MDKDNLNCTFYMTLAPDLVNFLKNQLPKNCDAKIYKELLTKNNLEKETEVLGVFTDSKITKEVFEQMPNLKIIVTLSTGFDNVNIEEAKKRNVPVCNVPKYGDDTVAEFTIGMMISLLRKIPQAIDNVQAGIFDCNNFRGTDLKNKTIGVIGTGKIGEKVVKKLSSFNVNFLAYDPYPKEYLEEDYNFEYKDLDKVLSKSDIITLHTPLLESTHHMIDHKAVDKMKDGVFIINTARGPLIDSEALIRGLEENKIAGAALDVMEEENLLAEPKKIIEKEPSTDKLKRNLLSKLIIDHERTIVTPHNAFNTEGAIKRIIKTSIENINKFRQGQTQNDVTKEK